MNISRRYFLIVFLAIAGGIAVAGAFAIPAAHAATITWIASGSGNWSTGSNWSGGVAPSSTDIALFSASSTANAAIDGNVNVAGIEVASGYTGTITQGSGYTVTVGTDGYSQADGTFTGGTANITINGAFSLSGGTFVSTTGGLHLEGSSTFAGTFDNNSGTVFFEMTSTSTTVSGSATFYALQLGTYTLGVSYYVTVATGTVLTVTATTTLQGDQGMVDPLGGGEIDAQGNVFGGADPARGSQSTFNFVLNGTGTQTVDGGSGVLDLPSLTINKPSGSVDLSGKIYIEGDWTNLSGTTVNPGTSYVVLFNFAATVTGSTTFYKLGLGTSGGDDVITVATGTVLTVQSSTYFNPNLSTVYLQGGGEIDAQGDVTPTYVTQGGVSTSTFNFVLNGTATQTISSWSNYNTFNLPNLTIDKPSGVVKLAGNITFTGGWTNLSGASVVSPGTSTVTFYDGTSVASGSTTFYNVDISDSGNDVDLTVATGTALTVQHTLTFNNNYTTINVNGGGEIDAQGDVSETYFGGWSNGGSGKVVMDGTGDQFLSAYPNDGSAAIGLPNLEINKTSGSVYSFGDIFVSKDFTVTQGEFRLSSSSVTANLEVDGTTTIGPDGRISDFPSVTSTLSFGWNVVNNGTVLLGGDSTGCSTPLPDYVQIRSTQTGVQRPWSGSGNALIRYADIEDQGGSVTVWNSYDRGNNTWTFLTGPRPQFVQETSASGGSGTTAVQSTFGFYPARGDLIVVAVSARNQDIAAPTDSLGSTYTLVSSSTFGSSPSYALSVYYAQDVMPTSTFTVTAHGTNSQSGSFLSMSAFEYTGMAPSSSFAAESSNTDTSGTATALTTKSAADQFGNDMFFGATTFSAATTASSASGWNARAGTTDNVSSQTLYIEDYATTTPNYSTAATWTSATSTSYAAILGIFHSPFNTPYVASGTLDSSVFDTGVASGTALNSLAWQGDEPGGTSVGFQIAVSNSASGPWSFAGPSGSASYFTGTAGTPISLKSDTDGYAPFSGYRYFRYRVALFSDVSQTYTPTVTGVVVNWSP